MVAGRVVVTAPEATSPSRLREIVRRRAPWILRHARDPVSPPPAPKRFVSGETLPYLGRNARLIVETADRRACSIRFDRWTLRVSVPSGLAETERTSRIERAVTAWYRERAAERLPATIAKWAPRLGLPLPRSHLIRDQRRRWASCASDGTLRFNWRVMMLPPPLIEYVVAHELTHLRIKSHSKAFWTHLTEAMPDAPDRRRRLRETGRVTSAPPLSGQELAQQLTGAKRAVSGEKMGSATPRRRENPMDTGFRWSDGLEGPARSIAELDHTPIRVLAGPGTGKTFALMRRVARLLQSGATPRRIMVGTFTRTAAKDLENELTHLGVSGASDVRAETLHAFCFRLLGRDEVLEATGRVPRPLLEYEERSLIEDLKSEFGGVRKSRKRLRAFEAAWARLQSETPGRPKDPRDRAFQDQLRSWLWFHKAMLIGELVPECLRYLGENPASHYRRTFDHVLVDEYQDLNRAEQELLDLLAESGSLIVVGDEDQSIYSFKHAHPQGIARFHQSHPETHDEELVECRRCPRRVVAMATALIAHNQSRAPRALTPRRGNPEGEVFVTQWTDMDQEAAGIARLIRKRIENQEVDPGDTLVLAPRRHFGYKVRDALRALDIMAHSLFYEEELDKDEAKQAFALLTLMANPDDRVALRCWCGFGSPSMRSNAWARLRSHCESSGDSPRTALKRLADGNLNIPYTRPLIARFEELSRRLSKMEPLRGQALVDAILPVDCDWAARLRSLVDSTKLPDEFDAEQIYECLRADITRPEIPTEVDYVRVMSLHKSKGLTAKLVAVVGCVEGLIPPLLEDDSPDKRARLEEQRRLFYVAVTRTTRILILSSVTQLPRSLAHSMRAQVRGRSQYHSVASASRFLEELGPKRPAPVFEPHLLR